MASVAARGDRRIMLTALQRKGLLLEIASADLQNDREVVATAMKQNNKAFAFASENLRGDEELVLNLLKIAPEYSHYGHFYGETNRNRALKLDDVLDMVSVAAHANRNIMLAALKKRGSFLEKASENLRDDHDVVMTAMRQDAKAYRFASENLRNDPEVAMAGSSVCARACACVSPWRARVQPLSVTCACKT